MTTTTTKVASEGVFVVPLADRRQKPAFDRGFQRPADLPGTIRFR